MNGVDIIVPVYNCKNTIERCIESVLKQSYKEYTLILVNDGSTDESGKLCEGYAEKNANIVYYKQENQGVSTARNCGLKIGKRDYIIFLDADDYLPSDSLTNYFMHISESDEWILGSYSTFRTYKKTCYYNRIEAKNYTRSEICRNFEKMAKWFSTPWAKMYKRELINRFNILFDSNMTIGEDNRFNLIYFSVLNGNIKTISESVYCYKLGGVASAIKYHENIKEEYLKLANTYDDLEQIVENSSSAIKFGLLSGTIKHYIVCLPRLQAVEKIRDTYGLWKSHIFNSTEKWYLYFQDEKFDLAYYHYICSNFKEILRKKTVRAIRLCYNNKIDKWR